MIVRFNKNKKMATNNQHNTMKMKKTVSRKRSHKMNTNNNKREIKHIIPRSRI